MTSTQFRRRIRSTDVKERHLTTRPGLTAGSNGHRIGSFLRGLDRSERRSLIGMGSVIVVLHLIGFGVLLALVVPQHFSLRSETPVFGVGVGVLAYTFGLRHAFDADHIAAVDNATRKLLSDAAASGELRRPFSVGFWFSLGHPTVVFALAFLLAIATRALAARLKTDRRCCTRSPQSSAPLCRGSFCGF